MICKNCGETAKKEKWYQSKPSKKFCEICLPDGQETPFTTYCLTQESD